MVPAEGWTTSQSPANVDHWKTATCRLRVPKMVQVEIEVEVPTEEYVTVTERVAEVVTEMVQRKIPVDDE